MMINSDKKYLFSYLKFSKIFRFINYLKTRMMCAMSSMNSRGFSSQVSRGRLPEADHITYQGVWNELTYQAGPLTDKLLDLHIGFCRAGNNKSTVDNRVHEFLALFMKSNADGKPRDSRRLNSVIVLDISGSMSGGLRGHGGQSRLELSKEAIKMFVSKLRPDDAFGLVIFDDKGETVVPVSMKKDLEVEAVFAMVDNIKTRGGTTLSSGFNEGVKTLKNYLANSAKGQAGCENRLVMLTDVGDNSLATELNFVEGVSHNDIHVTIIGISDEFRSSTCEKLNNVKGFNYFCAVEVSDLKKYLFENFDWTFFPSAYNVTITLESDDVKFFKVYGTPDKDKVSEYNNFAAKGNRKYTVTHIPTCFPSQLQVKDGIIHMHGGLILLELSPQPDMKSFTGQVTITGRNVNGGQESSVHKVHFQFPPGQQFSSEKCLEQAISGFHFVSEIKEIIDRMHKTMESQVTKEDKEKFVVALKSIRQTAPEVKRTEVDDMIKLVEGLKEWTKGQKKIIM